MGAGGGAGSRPGQSELLPGILCSKAGGEKHFLQQSQDRWMPKGHWLRAARCHVPPPVGKASSGHKETAEMEKQIPSKVFRCSSPRGSALLFQGTARDLQFPFPFILV